MKEKLIFFLLLVLNFSLNSQEIYDNFYKFKAELYNTPSEKTAAAIDEYGNKIEKMQISEEEKLTLQNFLVLEEINILNRDKNNKKKNPKVPTNIPISTHVGLNIVHDDGR